LHYAPLLSAVALAKADFAKIMTRKPVSIKLYRVPLSYRAIVFASIASYNETVKQ